MNRWLRAAAPSCFAVLVVARPAAADCVETAPQGTARPQVNDTFPDHGTSGYQATLYVVVSHGRGEKVFPRGLELQGDSEAARELRAAGFMLPDQDGGAAGRVSVIDVDAKSGARETRLDLPLLPLPAGPGRHKLVLPALPIVVARASGDVVTLCTKPHALLVDDPTASTPDAQPKPNPSPRVQREEWVALKRALAFCALGAVLGPLFVWLFVLWRRRPRPAAPPPPPRDPWEVALERLDEVRHAGLLETQRFSDFFDRVNDAVREYLGARFGFDGLESTTDETLAAIRRLPHFGVPMPELAGFLQHCDLVKFADLTPSLKECQHALVEAERVVRVTMPAVVPAPKERGGSR
jgi:hypothetical protein